jgi:DNA replication and repair protein RecF
MPIKKIIINGFRNLGSTSLHPEENINIIYGDNGSGKTSFLEAIHILGSGKSFRTSDNLSIIQKNKEEMSVFAEHAVDNTVNKLGIKKTITGKRKININNSSNETLSNLAYILPIQAITTNSYRIFHDGPKARRQFLDRGLFHVNPDFVKNWKEYEKALKQRNSSLKQRKSRYEIAVWNQTLSDSGERINELRQSYINELIPIINNLSTELLPNSHPINIEYKKGWENSYNIMQLLENNIARDQILGYTSQGPHRSDLEITTENGKALKNHLSQGQLKLVTYALHLAQDKLLKMKASRNYIILVDDITAEMDNNSVEKVYTQLIHTKSQCFITCIDPKLMLQLCKDKDDGLFHMKHGEINK